MSHFHINETSDAFEPHEKLASIRAQIVRKNKTPSGYNFRPSAEGYRLPRQIKPQVGITLGQVPKGTGYPVK